MTGVAPNKHMTAISAKFIPGATVSTGTLAVAMQAATQESPLVESSRRRVIAVQVGLEMLVANEVAALVQLEVNRDAALAALVAGAVAGVEASVEAGAIGSVFASGVDAVHAAATGKRIGLETELVAADAALGGAIDATAAIMEVRPGCCPVALYATPTLFLCTGSHDA